jgi:hypothetical protein
LKSISKRKALTLGQFIVSVYDARGKQRAQGIIRLAVNGNLIAFLERPHVIESKTDC